MAPPMRPRRPPPPQAAQIPMEQLFPTQLPPGQQALMPPGQPQAQQLDPELLKRLALQLLMQKKAGQIMDPGLANLGL